MTIDKRIFESRKTECKGGCKYCFGKWSSYVTFTEPEVKDDNTVIYPNCDGDFFDEDYCKNIEKIAKAGMKGVVYSISTKFNIPDERLYEVERINKTLIIEKNAFIKLSLSFSCSGSISEIEPNTAAYDERIALIKKICNLHIPYVTIIKPILPFIDFEEYRKIIDDTVAFSPRFVLGDLYVDVSNKFYEDYVKGRYLVKQRNISWNNGNGKWWVVESNDLKKRIVSYIKEKGGRPFSSDIDAINDIIACL